MNNRVYLDNNSTTLVDPRVAEVVYSHMLESLGNPSSVHSFGQHAKKVLERSRQLIADYLGVRSQEVIFTSGGTEGANMILRGFFPKGTRGHLITSDVEHSCVYSLAQVIEKEGSQCTFLPAGRHGAVQPSALKDAIRGDTKLIALMAVNNETGVKSDIEAFAEIALEAKVPLFIDAVALMGKEPFTIPNGVSALSFSGHKFHAPQGVGFIVLRKGCRLAPFMIGGEQEWQWRPGTQNLPAIVGMAKAVELLHQELAVASKRMEALRNHFEQTLQRKLANVSINGIGPRVVNISNLSFEGVEGETLLASLDLAKVAASHGSACASGALEPSRVLLNMGLSPLEAASSLRFSLSRMTTLDEIDSAIDIITNCIERLRIY